MSCPWWDRVFGTYQCVEWKREKPMRSYGLRGFFRISWYGPALPPSEGPASSSAAAEPQGVKGV